MKDELTLLKERADDLGIPYSNSIGVDTLRKRVNDAITPAKEESDETEAEGTKETKAGKKKSARQIAQEEQLALVRIRLTNMNPAKKDVPGAIYSISNKHIGIVRKYVPYVGAEAGYHVPRCIYELLKRKEFQQVRKIRDKNAVGGERYENTNVREFAIEVLPDLTQKELDDLALEQATTSRI